VLKKVSGIPIRLPLQKLPKDSTTRTASDDVNPPHTTEEIPLDQTSTFSLNHARRSCNRATPPSSSAVPAATSTSGLDYLTAPIGPLVLTTLRNDIQHIALLQHRAGVSGAARALRRALHALLVRSTDAPHIWRLKLELLTLIFSHAPARLQS